jgi:L,D-peptidoglycan transpeptidase YkuD (ErfK/YbiS/YcfS/YnhG family)
MKITLKNKYTLKIDDFKFKCCIGRNGLKKNKIEGDKCTPKGIFKLGTLYYRKDRVKKPITSLKTKKIKRNMGWCNDSKNKLYNQEIKVNKNIKHEKLFRKDYKYDYLLVIKYNTKKIKPNKGSAIFIHLTKNFKTTAGCIALLQKDFLIMTKLINKKSTIKIN